MVELAEHLTHVASEAAELERLHMRGRVSSATVADPVAQLSAPEVTYDSGGIVLATIKSVPLMKIGMKYPASTGPVDFSFQHLASAVQATVDPMIARPRIKLGHTDPRYNYCPCPKCDAIVRWDLASPYQFDGEVSFGFIEQATLTNEGGQITADFVDVPMWLATVMPVAFASRSIEGWFGYEGPNQKEYEFCITAVALLGVCWPGVMDLADLPKMYGETKPDFVVVQEAE